MYVLTSVYSVGWGGGNICAPNPNISKSDAFTDLFSLKYLLFSRWTNKATSEGMGNYR